MSRNEDLLVDYWSSAETDLSPARFSTYLRAMNGSKTGALRLYALNIQASAIVTELPFGFWRYLLSSRYQNTLWRSNLRHAFPELWPKNRATVYEPLEQAVELRNRIAHHEPIFRRELGKDLARIQQIIGWISPEALDWARQNLPSELINVGY